MERLYTIQCNDATPNGEFHQMVEACIKHSMDDSDVRRERLQQLVNSKGLAETARLLGKPDRQINDMLAKRKSFGARVARDMEKFAHLPKFYFDNADERTGRVETSNETEKARVHYEDEFQRQLNYFFEGMSQPHREALVNMANSLYSTDHPEDRVASPWNGVDRRKAQVVSLGELIEIEDQDADNNPHNRISEQGADKSPRRLASAGKKR